MKSEMTLPPKPHQRATNFRFEKMLCVLAAALTGIAAFLVSKDLLASLYSNYADSNWLGFARHSLFSVIIAFLVYGGLVYVLTRWAYYTRQQQHRPKTCNELAGLFGADAPTLSILIPAYKEEDKIVFQTMMSAALQQYPKKRVILLLDDPPKSKNKAERRALDLARTLPARVTETLSPMAKFTARARTNFYRRSSSPDFNPSIEFDLLFATYRQVINWFNDYASEYPVSGHADRAFVNSVLTKQSTLLSEQLATLHFQRGQQSALDADTILKAEYARLVAIFSVDVSSFERKGYENLSHEPNKAMNLNSYIGLMGKTFKKMQRGDAVFLQEIIASTQHRPEDVTIPAADFLITLDADSVIVPDYALRLTDLMLQPGNERLAVAQTPYSAFPGATKALERIAGATTDIQYIIHQGFTHFNGTFWVGANALIRRTALDDIAVIELERGYPVTRYIQDRTVIEDTESSVDLIERGWWLHNYPERMAFSATPPDFGALVIQRRRWANGGLIILPKLLRYLARGPFTLAKFGEAFVRIHYLVSIAAVNIGLVLALALPLATDITTIWLPFTAVGYFLLYGRDLKLVGYKYRDLFGVYAVNLLLIPVNLAGVFKSLQQAWTKERIPFGRTPKIGDRTTTQPMFVLALFALVLNWAISGVISFTDNYVEHGVFAVINASILLYATLIYLGLRNSWEDLTVGMMGTRQRYARNFYRGWRRFNQGTLKVAGKTPLVRLVIKPRTETPTANAAEQAKKAA